MKIRHKEYYKQCEILFHMYKQGFMKKSAFGEQKLFVSLLYRVLLCLTLCRFSLLCSSESLAVNKRRKSVTVDLHNSSLLCVD